MLRHRSGHGTVTPNPHWRIAIPHRTAGHSRLYRCTQDCKDEVSGFDLFIRLMDEKKYEGLLFGDISATITFLRAQVVNIQSLCSHSPKALLLLLEF